VISFNAKASADEAKKHEDFVTRMVAKGYTPSRCGCCASGTCACASRADGNRPRQSKEAAVDRPGAPPWGGAPKALGGGPHAQIIDRRWPARTSRSATASASCAATRSRSARRSSARSTAAASATSSAARTSTSPSATSASRCSATARAACARPCTRATRTSSAATASSAQGRWRRRQRQGPGRRLRRRRGRLRLRAEQGRVHAGLLRGPGAAAPGAHAARRGARVEEPARRLLQRRHAEQPARGALDARRHRPAHRLGAGSRRELREMEERWRELPAPAAAGGDAVAEARSRLCRPRSRAARAHRAHPVPRPDRPALPQPHPRAGAHQQGGDVLPDGRLGLDGRRPQGAEQALLHPAVPVPDAALREDRARLHPPPHAGAGGRRGELLPRPRDRRHGGQQRAGADGGDHPRALRPPSGTSTARRPATATTGTTTAAAAASCWPTSCCRCAATSPTCRWPRKSRTCGRSTPSCSTHRHFAMRKATEAARSTRCSATCSRRKGPKPHERRRTREPRAPAAEPAHALPRMTRRPLPLQPLPLPRARRTAARPQRLVLRAHRAVPPRHPPRPSASAWTPTRTSSRSSPPSR
jgi:hypothetical protein